MPDEVRHVLNAQQFDRNLLHQLFRGADQLRRDLHSTTKRQEYAPYLADRLLFNVFYEPSTRTRMSFAAAAEYLGMRVVSTENAKEFSSNAKGETLEDTIRVFNEYEPAAIVIRHHETGGAERAAAVSDVPIINAGDGGGEHPTQSLLDLYTIEREMGRLDDLTVLIGGDLANGRTARSLATMLARYDGIKLILVSPKTLVMDPAITGYLQQRGVEYEETTNLDESIREADVVYWTRIQKERFKDAALYNKVRDLYVIDPDMMRRMPKESILMHPLPRVNEITAEADSDPRSVYFRQAGNGLFVRMTLLDWLCRPG